MLRVRVFRLAECVRQRRDGINRMKWKKKNCTQFVWFDVCPYFSLSLSLLLGSVWLWCGSGIGNRPMPAVFPTHSSRARKYLWTPMKLQCEWKWALNMRSCSHFDVNAYRYEREKWYLSHNMRCIAFSTDKRRSGVCVCCFCCCCLCGKFGLSALSVVGSPTCYMIV